MDKYDLAKENEYLYLGCILKDPSLIDEVSLQPKHFYHSYSKAVFEAMRELKKDGEEVSTLSIAQLGPDYSFKYGGSETLSEMINAVPSIHGFKGYEKNILDFHSMESAAEIANEFIAKTKASFRPKYLTEFVDQVHKLESKTVKNSSSFKEKIKHRHDELMSLPIEGLSGVNTGFNSLNALTDGWQKGDLIIIGARPSMGKTAFILNSMLNACKQSNVFSTLFSLEMPEGPIIDRLIASEGRINLMKMKHPNKHFNDDDQRKYIETLGKIENLDIDIRNDNNVAEMRAAVRRNIKNNPDQEHVVFIDYLTLIKSREQKQSRNNEIEDIVLDLKKLALDLKVPVIVLSQLSRSVENRNDKRPMLSDLRESGSIEQAADIVGFLYRDDYYNPNTEFQGITEFLIAKHRNGTIGKLLMKFYKQTNYFADHRG